MIFKVISNQIWIKLNQNEKIWDVRRSSHTSEKKGEWNIITQLSGRYLAVEIINMDTYASTIVYLHKNGAVVVKVKDSAKEREQNKKSWRATITPRWERGERV